MFFNSNTVNITCKVHFNPVKLICSSFIIFLFLWLQKAPCMAASDVTYSHTHSKNCYDLGSLTCGKKTGSIALSLSTQGDKWTNEPELILLTMRKSGDLAIAKNGIEWNGETKSDNGSYLAGKNGKYTCRVYLNDGTKLDMDIKIENIDSKKPTLEAAVSPGGWTSENVTISLVASDEQSGLASKPYSFDGGNKFSASATHSVSKNGDYEVAVKDLAGNIRTSTVKVGNIDRKGPDISFFGSVQEGYSNSSLTLTVQASDSMSGLAKYPYSFNNGDNYTSNPNLKINNNGSYKVIVKDNLGNISEKTVEINTIDKDNPVITSVKADTSKWVKGGLTITVEAMDLSSGIADEGYSYDGGKTFVKDKTYEVTRNSTVNIVVRDKAGNTASQSFRVANIDNKGPSVSSVSKAVKKWTNKAYEISVTATDSESGLDSAAYSFDGGRTFSSEPVYLVKDNGMINICVRDLVGNITSQECLIDNLDFEGPQIGEVRFDNENWTNGKVAVTVSSSDSLSGLASSPYSFNGEAYTSSDTYKVDKNGDITIKVTDNAGNVSSKKISVSNIDKNGPGVKISKDVNGWTNGTVILSIAATDDEAGIDKRGYSFDGGKTFSNKTSLKVNSNNTYRIAVKDMAGNITYGNIEVNNIDIQGPVVSVSSDKGNEWTNGSVRLTLSCKDDLSGLAVNPYSLNGGKYSSGPVFEVAENGNYIFKVIDKAGNISTESFAVTNIDKSGPVITGIRKSTDEWTESGLTISVEATDKGAGLGSGAYSFDGGNNYVSTPSAQIKNNGEYLICVRDMAGNVSQKKITIANIGKNPSESEKERYEEQKEAEEREKEIQEAEAEKRRLEEEIRRKKQELAEASDDDNKKIIEDQLKDIEKDYEESSKRVISIEEKKKAAENNVSRLNEIIMEEKTSSLIGNVIEAFHDESKDITPVELDENGEYKKVSVKDYVTAENDDENEGHSEDGSNEERPRMVWLKGGIALLLLGLAAVLSLNYVYLSDGKKIRRLTFVKVKNDSNRILVSVPENKLREDGKYKIFYSAISRIIRKNKPVYVTVAGMENIFTTNEGKSFDYCAG